ncbi:RNA polymerase sigma factor [Thermoclostridium stercorarium]|uniref:RNA polymerase sigma factor n=1 Tax=Thermoclostridium stercorarium TaxID=1510 RepID=UPI002093C50E|nr:sigma factor [Thermoclostridium stercorarium]
MIKLLYSRFYNELLRFCVSLSHDVAFAEDIVQETYLRALANATYSVNCLKQSAECGYTVPQRTYLLIM